MPVQFDKFEQSKVDRLKNHLVAMAEKDKAKFYEIFVDSLKAVPKTDEPSEFEGYEDYLTPDSIQLKIVIYNSGNSPRNDQYIFMFRAQSREDAMDIGLNGGPERTYSYRDIGEWRKTRKIQTEEQMEISRLKKENSELKSTVKERDEEIEQLSEVIIEARQNGNKIGGINAGELLSVALEGIVRRNTHLIAQVPVLNGLAGIIERDNERGPAPAIGQPEGEVSFRMKDQSESSQTLTPAEKDFLGFFKELQTYFSPKELEQVIEILDRMSKDKSLLAEVVEMITDESEKEKAV